MDPVQGDPVRTVVAAGDTTGTDEVPTSRAARRPGTTVRRGVMEVSEVTRRGTVVRTARFVANWVPELREQPDPWKESQDKAG
ncbi:hypothetical protein [Streptomyces viridochromogenes]|uniref:hypothetical protein n=1 Tax=Streptomyces viridochromogenes TaxID=1938 RepID=UPI000997630B|nr:hypothetical protein [Streptomyces viridochromogenes]